MTQASNILSRFNEASPSLEEAFDMDRLEKYFSVLWHGTHSADLRAEGCCYTIQSDSSGVSIHRYLGPGALPPPEAGIEAMMKAAPAMPARRKLIYSCLTDVGKAALRKKKYESAIHEAQRDEAGFRRLHDEFLSSLKHSIVASVIPEGLHSVPVRIVPADTRGLKGETFCSRLFNGKVIQVPKNIAYGATDEDLRDAFAHESAHWVMGKNYGFESQEAKGHPPEWRKWAKMLGGTGQEKLPKSHFSYLGKESDYE